MACIVNEFEIAELKLLNLFDIWVDLKLREGMREACELLFKGVHMVLINMSISKAVNKFSSFKTANLGQHTG